MAPKTADHPPGIIIENMGEVLFIDKAVILYLDISPMQNLVDTIGALSRKIQELPNKFTFLRADGLTLVETFRDISRMITPQYGRQKRSIAPEIGNIFSALFGTATQESVDHYADQISKLTTWARRKENVFTTLASGIDTNTRLIGQMERKVNEILQHIKEKITDEEKQIIIQRKFLVLANLLTVFFQRLEILKNAIAQIDSGVVSTTLLSPPDLNKFLFQIKSLKGWIPFFLNQQVELYYPLLTPVRIADHILITIPFSPDEKYFKFHLSPFPSVDKNVTFTLDIPEQDVAMSADLTKFITWNQEQFNTYCIKKNQISICPSDKFPIITFNNEDCIKAIVRSQIVNKCPVKLVSPKLPLIKLTNQFTFLFFPKEEELILRCQNVTRIVKNQGPLKIKNTCSVQANSLKLRPGHKLDLTLKLKSPGPDSNPIHFFNFSGDIDQTWLAEKIKITTQKPIIVTNDSQLLSYDNHQYLTITNSVLIYLLPGLILITLMIYLFRSRNKILAVLTNATPTANTP